MRSWRVRLSCAVLAIALLSASTAFAAPTTGSADETIGFTETRTPGALRERIYGEPLTVDTPEIYLPTLDVGIATAGVVAERISGVDRYATAAAAALEASSTADTAVIVSGTQQLDAGFAAGLAGVYGCPVLATSPTALSLSTQEALTILGVSHVILIGDSTVISDGVASAIAALPGSPSVERVGGSTAAGRAEAVALRMLSELGSLPSECIAVHSWQGAIMAAPVAYSQHIPVLVTEVSGGTFTVPAETASALAELTPLRTAVLVTGIALGEPAVWGVWPVGTPALISDEDASVVSMRFADYCDYEHWLDWSRVGIANGDKGPYDAFGAGSLIGMTGGPVFLTAAESLSYCVDFMMYGYVADISEVYLFGGSAAISSVAEAAVNDWSQPSPPPPADFVAIPANRTVFLSWAPRSDMQDPLYKIWRATSAAGPYTLLGTTEATRAYNGGLTNGTTYWYRLSVVDQIRCLEGEPGVALSAQPAPAEPIRVYGQTRYETALAICRWNFAAADTAVIATGENFPDALSASGLCGVYDAPLLLTPRAALPDGLMPELDRLGVSLVFLIGGTNAIGPEVEATLKGAGYSVVRVAGSNRYDTSRLIAERVYQQMKYTGASEMILVRGDNYADALSASPWAYWYRAPVLLTRPTELPQETYDFCFSRGIEFALVVGGELAISPAVEAQLPVDETYRVYGSNRYTTPLALERAIGATGDDYIMVGVATGINYADALGGGVACGSWASPLLLTAPTGLELDCRRFIINTNPHVLEAQVYGGTKAVPDSIFNDIHDLLRSTDYY